MASSTIDTTKDALITALNARANLADVQIADGMSIGEPQPEMILVGSVRDWTQEWHTLNPTTRPKEETFSLNVRIRVLRGRMGISDARERAFVLFAELENMLRTDPEITSSVWVASVHDGTYEERESGQNCEAVIDAFLQCKARI